MAPTLGFNIKTLEYQNYKLNVWDVGGQQTIRSYWRNYYEQTDGLMFVIDSADQRRMEVSTGKLADAMPMPPRLYTQCSHVKADAFCFASP